MCFRIIFIIDNGYKIDEIIEFPFNYIVTTSTTHNSFYQKILATMFEIQAKKD